MAKVAMSDLEYEMLTGQAMMTEYNKVEYMNCFEFCLELGWLDHLGITTAKGKAALEVYEQAHPEDRRGLDWLKGAKI